jgi:long-chain acyl-CoA synthetase
VPIYPTLTDEQVAELLKDAGCRIAVVSTRAQYDKLQAVRGKTDLEKVVLMDPGTPPDGAIPLSSLLAGADEKGSSRDAVFDELVRRVEPEDLATLIYTSGTTGEPKGVMLTHGNVAANQNTAAVEFGLVHFVSAAVAHYGARAGLRDVQPWGASGVLLAVRQAAAGDERGSADGDCGRAAGV